MKDALVKAVPKSSIDYGSLIDDQAWATLLEVIRNDVTDAIFFTPAASTYRCEATEFVPALRALDGQGWFGLPGLPAAFKNEIKAEDLTWLRTAEICLKTDHPSLPNLHQLQAHLRGS